MLLGADKTIKRRLDRTDVNERKLFFLLVLSWFLVQLLFLRKGRIDGDEGISVAQALATQKLGVDIYGLSDDKPPIFLSFVSILLSICPRVEFARFVFLLLSACIACLTFLTARALGFDRKACIIAAAFLIFNEFFFAYAAIVHISILFTFLLSLSAYLWASRRYPAAGVMFAISAFTLQVGVLPFLGLVALMLAGAERKQLPKFASAFAVAFAVLGSICFLSFGPEFVESVLTRNLSFIAATNTREHAPNAFEQLFWQTPISVLALVGLIGLSRRQLALLFFSIPLVAFFAVYPFTYIHHLFSVLPFFSVLWAKGVLNLPTRHNTALAVLLVLAIALNTANSAFVVSHFSKSISGYESIGNFIKQLTRPDDFIFSDDRFVYFYAYRRPPELDHRIDMKSTDSVAAADGKLVPLIEDYNVTVVAITSRMTDFPEFMESLKARYQLVRSFSDEGIDVWLKVGD